MSLIPQIAGIIAGTSSGGGGGGGSIPHDMASLQHWYRAKSEAFANNDPVGALTDQKGSANAVQATSGMKPVFKTNSGNPYVEFDGSDDELDITLSAMGDFAYVMVLNWASDTGDYARVLEDGVLSVFIAGTPPKSGFFNIAGNGITLAPAPFLPLPSGFMVVYLERSGTSAKVRINGSETTGSFVTNVTGTTLRIGSYSSPGYNTNIRLKEFLIFDNNLSGGDFSDLTAYILSEHGLTL